MMKPFQAVALYMRKAGIALLAGLLLIILFLILRAALKSPLAEAATNTYNPGNCLGGWENSEAASGKPGKTEPNGKSSAAYLAPDVFAQIFCGYFPVTTREKPPKEAKVTFNFSLSGEAPAPTDEEPEDEQDNDSGAPADEESGGGNDGGGEEPPAEEPSPVEDPAPEEPAQESAPEESGSEASSGDEGGESSAETSFLDFFIPHARADESTSENLLVVSYSFDGVRWYAAGRVTRENAHGFSIQVPSKMWSELQNLQVMVAPLPITGERPDIFLESVDLKVEADLTISEMAADSAAAVGGVIGEVLGVTDTLSEAALGLLTPQPLPMMQPVLPPPPVKKKALQFAPAGDAISVESSGNVTPEVDISADGLTLRVDGDCKDAYYVILTYRSIEDFEENPRAFASNFADECRGKDFHSAMKHLPVDTEPGVYYLLVASQGNEGSWTPVSSLMPIQISETEVMEEAP